jgi:predicted esterase
METRHVPVPVHGRVLYERKNPARLLVGLHGFAQLADIQMEEMQRIPGVGEWSVASVQALHPFYMRNDTLIGACWMTRQDRELRIAENLEYVRRVVGSFPRPETLVFLGFSQGVATTFRAAADFAWRCQGVIALGGDVPPDVAQEGVHLAATLLARGKDDDWYSSEKFEKDLKFLRGATDVTTCVFDGGHEWTDEFRAAAGAFLQRLLL